MQKVLIGITSKNRASILPRSIQSGLNQQYQPVEVAVYDDHSTDGTRELSRQYPQVTWNFSEQERGYLFGRNQFLNATDAAYYCSLDDDSWFLQYNKLGDAVTYMNEHPDVAVLAFKILSPGHDNSQNKPAQPAETNNFIGCGHMLRVSAVNEAGNYAVNPGYYGGEEKDLCLSLINKGFKIMWYPQVEIWHDKTMVARNSPRQHRSGVCNDFVFMWRRTPGAYLLPAFLQKLYVHFLFPVRYKNLSLYRPMLAGMWDFIKVWLTGKVKRQPVTVTAFKKYLSFNK